MLIDHVSTSADLSPMQRVALTRLRRFERIAAVAESSNSPFWRELARQAAASALRDCLLLGLPEPAGGAVPRKAA